MRPFFAPLARLRRHRLPLWQAWLLALALLGAQGLGALHALAHGHGAPTSALVAAAVGDAAAPDTAAGPSWFGGHEAGSSACRLLDQLAPDALVLPALELPSAPPAPAVCTAVAAPTRALQAPGLPQARAPPSLACA